MVTALNNVKTLCGYFGIYPSFVAGILNSARRIDFFLLCNENLYYENYIEKCIGDKECSVCYSHIQDIISNYRTKERQFLLNLKQDYVQFYRPK